ncbi:MAG: DNA-protecting protein DprA [Zetaproteobacteria bacterium]|nr:DNA-protecting protein DprA [Zetaproteobacteria bacterium]
MISSTALGYLRLAMVSGVGPLLARRMLEYAGSIEQLWQLDSQALKKIPGIGDRLTAQLMRVADDEIKDVVAQCQTHAIAILCPRDEAYPSLLRQVDDAPLVLFVRGDRSVLASPLLLSVVGARQASREGQLIARRWCRYCAGQGVVIVSGMAYGIDASAHGGALESKGSTIAVLGSGLLALNSDLQQRQVEAIAKRGCVISEYLPHVVAKPQYFPQRNRIIAAMSTVTLVVEASLKSGSLITARLANEYGREVVAVPGSVLASSHSGCHHLIREGARLVESADEVLQLLKLPEMAPSHRRIDHDDEEQVMMELGEDMLSNVQRVLVALQREVLHVDQLAEICCLTHQELSPILLDLELQGRIERMPGSRYILGGEQE